jgi:hypothetical protein
VRQRREMEIAQAEELHREERLRYEELAREAKKTARARLAGSDFTSDTWWTRGRRRTSLAGVSAFFGLAAILDAFLHEWKQAFISALIAIVCGAIAWWRSR